MQRFCDKCMTFQTNFTLLLNQTFYFFQEGYFVFAKGSLRVRAVVYLSNILIGTQKSLDVAEHLRYRHLQVLACASLFTVTSCSKKDTILIVCGCKQRLFINRRARKSNSV